MIRFGSLSRLQVSPKKFKIKVKLSCLKYLSKSIENLSQKSTTPLLLKQNHSKIAPKDKEVKISSALK